MAGYTDDAAALVACLKAVIDNVTQEIKAKTVNKLHDWLDNAVYQVIIIESGQIIVCWQMISVIREFRACPFPIRNPFRDQGVRIPMGRIR